MTPSLHAFFAFLVAFIACILLCRVVRKRFLSFTSREQKPGKERIHTLFPKPRKPLGGGIAIIIALAAGFLATPDLWSRAGWAAVACAIAFGALGFLDDAAKVKGRGFPAKAKFTAQAVLALGFALCVKWAAGRSEFYVPFAGAWEAGWLYVPLAALVIAAASNAVNLADGIDGLAGASAALAFAFYWAWGLMHADGGLAALGASAAGACAAYLIYNFPPARLLMGDTGALGLGALLGMAALASGTEWLLLLVGGVFVIDALSVIVQTGTIRFLRGPVRLLRHRTTEIFRPFLMAPLHHHFQWVGWSEKKILAIFCGIAFGLTVIGALAGRFNQPWFWVLGLAAEAAILMAAAFQKILHDNFFLGLQELPSQEPVLAVYRGLPVEVMGRRLCRPWKVTDFTRSALPALAGESLWRSMSEVEAAVLLGKIYARQGRWDEAIEQWEQVPPRSLLLREDVLVQLGKAYYARDLLLKAIRLWGQLPADRLETQGRMGNFLRIAKVRLAELAGKAHRQSLRTFRNVTDKSVAVEQLERARRLNRDLLSLLVSEREKRHASAVPFLGDEQTPEAAGRELFRELERRILVRLEEIEAALAVAREPREPVQPAAWDSETAEACSALGISPDELAQAFAQAPSRPTGIAGLDRLEKPSRNAIFRIHLRGSDPESAIVKAYEQGRIDFFSACYRRERGLLERLWHLGCPVPRVYGGVLHEERALLVMEDAGAKTLEERLASVEPKARLPLLRRAVATLAELHGRSRGAVEDLQAQVLKADKEVLSESYYIRACITAVERVAQHLGLEANDGDIESITSALQPVAQLLAAQPKAFIHFEYAPHHVLLADDRMVVFDFEQATIGPPEFDLATLLAFPDSGLTDVERQQLAEHYWQTLDSFGAAPVPHRAPEALDYATVVKSLFYAGAAANFYRKFCTPEHVERMKWYLRECESVLARHETLAQLRDALAPYLRGLERVGE